MDVDKAIAQITAAGIELTDRRRTDNDNGWALSFSNGAMLSLYDSGHIRRAGKGLDAIARALGEAAPPAKARASKR